MAIFVDLAPELMHYIGQQAEENDVKSLRLVCKPLAVQLRPLLYRCFVLQLGGASDAVTERETEILRALATDKNHPARSATQELVIGKQCYTLSKKLRAQSRAQLELYLRPALESLKNLVTLRWLRSMSKSDFVTKDIVQALTDVFPRLRVVTLPDLQPAQVPLLNELSGLTSFTVSIDDFLHQDVCKALYKAIRRSASTLRSLHVSGYFFSKHGCIQDVLGHPQGSDTKPHLVSLTLEVEFSRFWSPTPTLPYLYSLQVCRIDVGLYGRGENDSTPGSQHDFWAALQSTGAKLRVLTCTHASRSLIEYLKSYANTLEELVIEDDYSESTLGSEDKATELVASMLPLHRSSLRVLRMYSVTDGGWCFSPATGCLFSETWPKLTDLDLGAGPTEDPYGLKLLIQMVVQSPHLPALRSLEIQMASYTKGSRMKPTTNVDDKDRFSEHPRSVLDVLKHTFRDDSRVGTSLQATRDPPEITTGVITFCPVKVDGEWRYMESQNPLHFK